MLKKLNFKITIFKTVFLILLFQYGLAFSDLSNDVKWNANLVVVEAAIKAGDYRDAFALLQGPAREGHAKSQYYMGMFYHNGLGVLEDAVEASKWYRLAAEQGDAISQFYLGFFYGNGLGLEKDSEEASKWYFKAASQGVMEAQYNLATMYQNGVGVIQNYEKAFEWHLKAAEQGMLGSQVNVGIMYENSIGTKKDISKAMEWYLIAAERNESQAQFNLAVIYHQGSGNNKDVVDFEKALKWYNRAARQGYADAQNNLAIMHYLGEGIIPDPLQAYMWLNISVANGNLKAINLRDTVKRNLSTQQITEVQKLAKKCLQSNYADCSDDFFQGNLKVIVDKNKELEDELKITYENKLKEEEQAKIQAEEEARKKAEEEARLKAEEEARKKAEEEARLKAEEEARKKAEEEARLKAEEEARKKAEEEARLKAEEEANLNKEKTPLGDDAVNWLLGLFKSGNPSTESETLKKYKEKENLISNEQFKPYGEETVNKIFNQLGIDPKKLRNINIFGSEKNNDNNSDERNDRFVPIGDEFINNFLNGFRNNQTDKSPDAWFNNDQTFYEQLKRKYKYTTDDKKGMMLDIIIKEIKKEKKISEDEAKKIAYEILKIN